MPTRRETSTEVADIVTVVTSPQASASDSTVDNRRGHPHRNQSVSTLRTIKQSVARAGTNETLDVKDGHHRREIYQLAF